MFSGIRGGCCPSYMACAARGLRNDVTGDVSCDLFQTYSSTFKRLRLTWPDSDLLFGCVFLLFSFPGVPLFAGSYREYLKLKPTKTCKRPLSVGARLSGGGRCLRQAPGGRGQGANPLARVNRRIRGWVGSGVLLSHCLSSWLPAWIGQNK